MKISELCDMLNTPARVAALDDAVKSRKIKSIALNGLVGSAPAVVFSRLPKMSQPYLIVANDLDEAGYLYNDLCQINGDEQVLLFPRATSATSNTVRKTRLRRFYARKCSTVGTTSAHAGW